MLEPLHFLNHACEPNACILFADLEWILQSKAFRTAEPLLLAVCRQLVGWPNPPPIGHEGEAQPLGHHQRLAVVVATQPVARDTELVLDYAHLAGLDEASQGGMAMPRGVPEALVAPTKMDCNCPLVASAPIASATTDSIPGRSLDASTSATTRARS